MKRYKDRASKFKIPAYQNGHAYLTSHRACYVDNAEPRKNSIAVDLKQVERCDYYAGFLKSSAKVTLYPKASRRSALTSQGRAATPPPKLQPGYLPSRDDTVSPGLTASNLFATRSLPSTPRPSNATWICPICSYSNPIPSNFDAASASAHTPVPPCLACGIKPPFAHVLKAAIAAVSRRSGPFKPPAQQPLHAHLLEAPGDAFSSDSSFTGDYAPPPNESKFRCPRCTFQNHPSLLECELCGASLLSVVTTGRQEIHDRPERPESPGPILEYQTSGFDKNLEGIKFSFRAGGDKIFHERLKGAMTQRKWLLQNAPPIPQATDSYHDPGDAALEGQVLQQPRGPQPKVVGIAGLERRGLELRKKNETVIGGAFEDLEALMASAKEIVALAERFSSQSADKGSEGDRLLEESATALGMVTTKDMLGSKTGSDSLYLSELSRNLAEYLTDDTRGILRKEGGIMSLVDLWAVFNRSRGGVELISPADFEKAARMWEKLSLPVRLRQFKNGLLVVQGSDRTDDKTVAQLLVWLQQLHAVPPGGEATWDWKGFGRGVTAQDTAVHFGWSIGVASEELEMAEERGALCRDEGVEGTRYWENRIVEDDDDLDRLHDYTTSSQELEL
ncbi:MAG: hypothetical protein Q9174_000059 [Haloplaca sp. 1 TL-2023]